MILGKSQNRSPGPSRNVAISALAAASHAAVVARGMGKCCISGAGAVQVDYKARTDDRWRGV